MRRKCILAGATVVFILLSVVLAGGQAGEQFRWWGNREPIYIYGNDGFTFENGVVAGSGTAEDPFVIEGWYIANPPTDYGIYLDHTSAHVVIRDCVVERAQAAGIYFNSVANARVEGCQLSLNGTGIHLLNSRDNVIEANAVAENFYGVLMTVGSRNNIVRGNSFIDNGQNATDPEHKNAWTWDGVGNYWSDYVGYDCDGDGVGDLPYYRVADYYPLVSPLIPWTRVVPAEPPFFGLNISPEGAFVITSETPIVLTARDPGSGLAQIYYSIDGGQWQEYTGPFALTGQDGPRQVAYYGLDNLGNTEAITTLSFLLDNTPPKTAIDVGQPNYREAAAVWVTSKTPIALRLVAGSSYGVTKTYYSLDGGPWRQYREPFKVRGIDGPHQIRFYSQNASGITEAVQRETLYKDDAPPVTRGGGTTPGSNEGPTETSSTVVTPEAEPEPEPEQQSELVPEPIVEPEPAPELPIESIPSPEAPQTAPASDTE